jgi:hypothetical protein
MNHGTPHPTCRALRSPIAFSVLLATLLVPLACSNKSTAGAGGSSSSATGAGTAGTGSGGSGGGMQNPLAASCGGPMNPGDTTIQTNLPTLPQLGNVNACVHGNAVNVTFDPLDAATDYRIYPLPANGDITTNADGSVVVKDAVYRCAGRREALYMLPEQPAVNDNAAGGATIVNGQVEGYGRTDTDSVLGYVYTTPGPDRVPVYVLGNGDAGIENGFAQCGRPVFNSTRPKTYTTDDTVRAAKIAMHSRDDGIAFYIPSAASSATHPVYEGTFGDSDVLRWTDGPEGTMRMGKGTPLLQVLTATGADTAPLMRVHVQPYCGQSHDELVAGSARYKKVRAEGDQPLNAVRWSGLTADTVLVVEALDNGCPYQGFLSTEHQDAFSEPFGNMMIQHEAYLTLDDMRAASSTSEVFVNGQYEGGPTPKAIARSFIKATPAPDPMPAFEFSAAFPMAASETFQGVGGDNPPYVQHYQSTTYDMQAYNTSSLHAGTQLGEMWFSYSDIAADTNGKIRLTPHVKGTISASSFLHVTAEVDVLSTQRRYPQIIISDQASPVQENLEAGTTLIVQPKDMTPSHVQVQICDHRTWDVNNQCPLLPTFGTDFEPNVILPGELTGTDNAVLFDVFLSESRIYVALNGEPYSCIDLPAKADDGNSYHPPTGPVTVTFGDVLYHSAVDFESGSGPVMGDNYLFHRNHMLVSMRRHFANLGFLSNQPAPTWDESRFPCVKAQ